MAGESILVVDNDSAVQDLCRNVLEMNGYRVAVAANGVAALSHPDLTDVDLLIIDTKLQSMDGYDTTKLAKTDEELHKKPVLLLVPEENLTDRESQNLMGGNGYIRKPFEPATLVNKVQALLEEKVILEQGREYLRKAADDLMRKLAEHHIQEAVQAKTQIIIERALQLVVTQVDAKARKEVENKVTQLTTEKEQELVKTTVHEVARSMVEKLAERKVNEAMDSILREETERSVLRVTENIVPGLIRDRVRDAIEQTLPKEVQRRVQKEAENLVPEASQKVISVIESAAQKIVPKIGKEIVAEQTEARLAEAMEQTLPRHVQGMVSTELEAQIRIKIAPLIKEAAQKINRRTRMIVWFMILIFVSWVAVALLNTFYGDKMPWANVQGMKARLQQMTGGKAPKPTPTPTPKPDPLKSFIDQLK